MSKENEHSGLGAAKTLVLASTSRYRALLLARLRLTFNILDPAIDETPEPNEDPRALALRLAIAKAQTPRADANAWVLGSDQVLACENRILGKPGSREKAMEQLSVCSGLTVTFYTAVCLSHRASNHCDTRVTTTRVTFRHLKPQEIANYIDAEPALDCAGSFKIEGLGISLFTEVTSADPTALEGLPLISVAAMLRKAEVMR